MSAAGASMRCLKRFEVDAYALASSGGSGAMQIALGPSKTVGASMVGLNLPANADGDPAADGCISKNSWSLHEGVSAPVV